MMWATQDTIGAIEHDTGTTLAAVTRSGGRINRWLSLISMLALAGCDAVTFLQWECNCYLTACEDSGAIQINDGEAPTVPDQQILGCNVVSITRIYQNDNERSLIMKAESLPSTAGPTWVSATRTASLRDANGDPLFLFAGAVNAEALSYYANRVRAFQQTASPENPRIGLEYTARAFPTVALTGSQYVSLELTYTEPYGPRTVAGFTLRREVEFDQDGNVTAISGDDVEPMSTVFIN